MNYETMNEWFLTLPENKQKILREDKWMLANAAFETGRNKLTEDQMNLKKFVERIISEAHYQKTLNDTYNFFNDTLTTTTTKIDILSIAKEFNLYNESE